MTAYRRYPSGMRLSLFALLVLASCAQAPPYVQVPRPVGVERAPRETRDGHVFYWVTDRWYVENAGNWYAYPPPRAPQMQYKWGSANW